MYIIVQAALDFQNTNEFVFIENVQNVQHCANYLIEGDRRHHTISFFNFYSQGNKVFLAVCQ
jgi:hypothetical protein